MSYKSTPIVDSQGEQTNPTTSTVMADTGTVTNPGFYEVFAVISATANAQFQLEHRNAANDGNTSDACVCYCAANAPAVLKGIYFVNASERLRVMMNANLTGDAVATVYATRVQ